MTISVFLWKSNPKRAPEPSDRQGIDSKQSKKDGQKAHQLEGELGQNHVEGGQSRVGVDDKCARDVGVVGEHDEVGHAGLIHVECPKVENCRLDAECRVLPHVRLHQNALVVVLVLWCNVAAKVVSIMGNRLLFSCKRYNTDTVTACSPYQNVLYGQRLLEDSRERRPEHKGDLAPI